MHVMPGIAKAHQAQAAALYWQAFGGKLGRVMRPEPRALAFINRVLDPSHAISAVAPNGALLGVAGFKTYQGALVGGDFSDLRAVYGIIGASWRALLLSALERDTDNTRFLMDGIFVTPQARGQGVGTALLNAIAAQAQARGYHQVRLDVIDSNPRARALYERRGFVATETNQLGPLRHIFGFTSATTMVRQLPDQPS